MKATIPSNLKSTLVSILLVLLALAAASTASAATTTWINNGAAWATAGNWDNGTPAAGGTAVFNSDTYTVQPTINAGVNIGQLDLRGAGTLNGTYASGTANFAITSPIGILMESTAGPVNLAWNLLPGGSGNGTVAFQNNSTNLLTLGPVNTGGHATLFLDGPGTIVVNGNMSNGGKLILSNSFSGLAILNGTNTFTGGATVNGGTLLVNVTVISNVTVNAGGTLGGNGSIGGIVAVNAGGTLAPGTNAFIGTLVFTNSLSLAGTNLMKVNRNGSQADKLIMTNGNTVTLGGVLSIANLGSALQNGDSFTLIGGTMAGAYASITPAVPGAGLQWNTNGLGAGGDGTLRVFTAGNVAPVAGSDTYTLHMNSVFTTNAPGVLLNDTDANGDPLIAITNSAPAHGTLAFNTNGGFTYTPNGGYSGGDAFTYQAYDGQVFSPNATVTLNVVAVDTAPVANNEAYSLNRNGVFTTNAPGVLANDTDAESDPLTATNFTSPAHGTLTFNQDGSFTYTSTNHYVGTDTFTYRAYDGQLTSQVATVTLTVVEHAPVAVNDTFNLTTNSFLTVAAPGVLGNDTDADADVLTAAIVAGPAHGSLVLNADGSFTFTPDSTYFGSDSFTYLVNDGLSNSASAKVTLTTGAGSYIWDGSASGSWNTAANWSANDLPMAKTVRYDNTSTAHLTQTLDRLWSISGLVVSNLTTPVTIANGNTLTNTGNLDMSGAGADLTILADYVSTLSGTLSVAANRTLTLSNFQSGGNGLDSASGPGTLRMVGRASQMVDCTNSLTFIVDGGYISSNPPVRMNGESGGAVRLIVTNNGTVEITGNGSSLHLGRTGNVGTPGTNILNLESGSIRFAPSGNTSPNAITVPNGANCYGILNLNGGLMALTNKYSANTTSAGETWIQIPAIATGNGVVNLNGGTLVVPVITGVTPTTGSGTLNFNGTVVVANRPNTAWITNIQNAYVQSGGAIFDTDTNDVTVAQSLQAGSPSGGVTKRGSGILRLTGNNSYTGATVVGNGTLAVAASSGSYPASSPLVASNGASLNLDVSGGGTVSLPSATLNGATLNLSYGSLSGNPGSPAINNSGGGIALSATGVNTINISGTGFTAGDVPLITYTGAIGGGGFGAFQLVGLPPGVVGGLVNDTINSVIVLRLTRAPVALTWFGDKSANWNTTQANWNSGAVTYTEGAGVGDSVTFDDTLDATALNTNINLTATFSPLSMLVNNYSYPYRLGGPGSLSGPGTLGKDGTMSLTLATANSFTGGSALSNGVVYLANDAGLGVGTLTMQGGTLSSDGATARTVTNSVTFAKPPFTVATGIFGDGLATGSLTLSGPINWSGLASTLTVNNNVIFTGTLSNGGLDTKTGPGTLTFQGATDASTAGNLQVEDGAMIVSSGTLNRAHGGIRVMALGSATQHASFAVSSGATVLLDGAVNVRLGNNPGDPNGINVADIYGTLSCTTNDIAGQVQLGTNCLLAQLNLRAGGLLRVGSITSTGPASEMDFYGGTLAGTTNQTTFLQGLTTCWLRSGGVTVSTLGLAGQSLSLTIGQALLEGGSASGLTKTNNGALTLTGANTYLGPTRVNGGTLQLSGATTSQSSLFSVADGSTLTFAPNSGVTLALAAATVGSSTGAVLSVTVPGSGNPTNALAWVTNLTLVGSVPVNVQGAGMVTGTVPLISYSTLTGGGLAAGSVPNGFAATVTNDTSVKIIKLIITKIVPNYSAPVATNDAYSLGKNGTMTVAVPGVLTNDSVCTNTLTLTASRVALPTNGTLVSFNSDGSFVYQPNAGFVGGDSFTYKANDGISDSAAATVSLTITNVTVIPPIFSASAAGTNLVLNATGGSPGAPALVLTSTNLTQPMTNWTMLYSNVLDGSGSLHLTNGIDRTVRQQFFRIELPQ